MAGLTGDEINDILDQWNFGNKQKKLLDKWERFLVLVGESYQTSLVINQETLAKIQGMISTEGHTEKNEDALIDLFYLMSAQEEAQEVFNASRLPNVNVATPERLKIAQEAFKKLPPATQDLLVETARKAAQMEHRKRYKKAPNDQGRA